MDPIVVIHGGAGGGIRDPLIPSIRDIIPFHIDPAVVIHGGADNIPNENLYAPIRAGIKAASLQAYQILKSGGSAIDAVKEAMVFLEDNPHFNAGIGSSLTSAGTVECDAMLMDGRDLRFGAVCSVSGIKNPILAAKVVMDHTPHHMFSGRSVEQLAASHGLELVPPESMISETSRARLAAYRKEQQAQREETLKASPEGPIPQGFAAAPSPGAEPSSASASSPSGCGQSTSTCARQTDGDNTDCGVRGACDTVGAVAIDSQGNVAAATSTGGYINKMPGRVGDSPCVGSGTLADNESGAVSCTGTGELILRVCLAHHCAELMRAGLSAQEAAERSLDYMERRTGEQCAGLICVKSPHCDGRVSGDGAGAGAGAVGGRSALAIAPEVGLHWNTKHMTWAFVRSGELHYGARPGEHIVEKL